MEKVFIINFEGVYYYGVENHTIINMSYDVVTRDNYRDVSDFDCFSINEPIEGYDHLECLVMDYVGNTKLHEEVLPELEKIVNDKIAYKIVLKIEGMTAIRENFILANFDRIEAEGNLLHIYSKTGEGFTVDFRLNEKTVGEIVG